MLRQSKTLTMIFQAEAAECGLACLAMISCFYRLRISLSELRRQFPVSLNGTTFKTLIAIADQLGFTSRPIRLGMSELQKVKKPCILHWDLSHYVVLSRVGAKFIEIYDPALGVRRLSRGEVSKHFTGAALELMPAPQFQERQVAAKVRISDLWSRVDGFIPSVVQIIVLSLSLQMFSLISPLIGQSIIDSAVSRADLDLLNVLVVGGFLLLLCQLGAGLVRDFVSLYVTTHFTFQIRGNLLHHILNLPVGWFERRRLGDIVSRFNSLQPIQDFLLGGLVSAVLDGVMAVFTLVVMIIYSRLLAGIVIGSLGLHVIVRCSTFGFLKSVAAESIQYQAKTDGIFLETIRGARSFKIFGREGERHAIWQNAYADSVNSNVRLRRLGVLGNSAASFQLGVETLLVLFFGARAIIDNELTIGMLFAFQAYRNQFSNASLRLTGQFSNLRMLSVHLERLADAMHEDRELARDADADAVVRRAATGLIELRGVSFRYAEHEPWILKNIDLSIRPGEFVVFVGPSGGGKSTLLKILMGLYAPNEGTLLIDGIPLSSFGVRALRDQVGVVMQDDILFSGTIADNIAFFDAEPDRIQVENVARGAAIHDEIMKMPMAYQTLVGDLGSTLSGGQRQRILLARALYGKPSFIFLDEGTANLDPATEHRVMEIFRKLHATKIAVAHRPNAIEGATRTYVVDQGSIKLVEQISGKVASVEARRH